MSNTRSSRVGSIVAFALSAVFIAAATWLVLNRQYALDQVTVWGYQPTSEVETITKKVEFTDKGQFIFYATKPQLEDQSSFNKQCPRQEAGSPILGCYTTDDRIYIYNLSNQQLSGMEEVTAAHEMLHAVWYRMSASERSDIEAELMTAYEKLENADLKARMEYYERTEPGEFANELHSILGTEVDSLSDSLEAYYGQYFDRSTVLALHKQYSSVYSALHDRATELYASMQSLSAELKSQTAAYDAAVAQLSSDINSFNQRARDGGFSSQAQFNRERAALAARSAQLERDRLAINESIETYNQYYAEYQELAKQIEVLNDSIDSYKQIEEAPSV